LPLENSVEAIGAIVTEAGGALRTLFIRRTPDRSEMEGVETLLDPAGRPHARYGTRQPSWYLIRPDQYVAARRTLEELDLLRSYISSSQRLERHEDLVGGFAVHIFKTHADAEQTHMLFLARVGFFEQSMKNLSGGCMG
jgi:hypothetical protein